MLYENCIKVHINKDSTRFHVKNLSVALIPHKAIKKLFIKFSAALFIKYQVPTIEYTLVTYKFILLLISIVCSSLPCSSYKLTYYHLPVPHSVFGKLLETLFDLNYNHFSSIVTFVYLPTFTVDVTKLFEFNDLLSIKLLCYRLVTIPYLPSSSTRHSATAALLESFSENFNCTWTTRIHELQ